jgi:hypothetical protein
VQRRHRTTNRIVEYFVELCQKGIERVQGVHKRTQFQVPEEECQGEDTHRVFKHSVSSKRSA